MSVSLSFLVLCFLTHLEVSILCSQALRRFPDASASQELCSMCILSTEHLMLTNVLQWEADRQSSVMILENLLVPSAFPE